MTVVLILRFHTKHLFQELLTEDLFNSFQELLITLWTFIREICKSLQLKSSKLKMVYQLSSWMMFSSLSKNHTPTNNFAFQVEEDPYNKIWLRNLWLTLAPNYGTLSQMNIKLLNHSHILRQKQKLGSQRTVLAGYAKTYIHKIGFI